MKINQKGFSVVEILVILVIVGLIGTVGWLVYNRQNNNKEQQTTTKTENSDAKPEIEKKTTLLSEGDRKVMVIQGAKVSFIPPSGWTIETVPSQMLSNGQESGGVTLKSPDYKEEGSEFQTIVSGISFSVSATHYGAKDVGDPFLRSKSSGSTNVTTVMVGGQKGVQYFFNPGEFGISLSTDVTYNKLSLNIEAPPQESASLKEPYRTLYDNLVSSIKFE